MSMETGGDFGCSTTADGAAWRTVATYKAGDRLRRQHLLQQGRDDPRATYAYPTAAKLRFVCDAGDDTDDAPIDEIVFRGYTAALRPTPADEAAADKAPPAPFALGRNRPNRLQPVHDVRIQPAGCLARAGPGARPEGAGGRHAGRRAVRPGSHSVRWDATEFASGTYFYRIDAGERSSVRKMTLLK
ncbi:MAG: hypothetical protein IPH09_11680 [bacterium]|nr:hypothetical protein [bacterium]